MGLGRFLPCHLKVTVPKVTLQAGSLGAQSVSYITADPAWPYSW